MNLRQRGTKARQLFTMLVGVYRISSHVIGLFEALQWPAQTGDTCCYVLAYEQATRHCMSTVRPIRNVSLFTFHSLHALDRVSEPPLNA